MAAYTSPHRCWLLLSVLFLSLSSQTFAVSFRADATGGNLSTLAVSQLQSQAGDSTVALCVLGLVLPGSGGNGGSGGAGGSGGSHGAAHAGGTPWWQWHFCS